MKFLILASGFEQAKIPHVLQKCLISSSTPFAARTNIERGVPRLLLKRESTRVTLQVCDHLWRSGMYDNVML